jgi:drug/metabolite transporter (DMT)-like permease
MTFTDMTARIGIAVAVTVSGASHAYLYIHGYRHIPTIGEAFALQASISFACAVLILLGGPSWLRWVAAMVAGGALVAFVLSRTVGLFGFPERGWQPSPHAAVSVVTELLTVLLWAAYLVDRRRTGARREGRAAPKEAALRRQGPSFR